MGPGIAYFLLAPKCYCCWSEKQDSQRSLQKQKCRLIAICKYLLSTYSVQGHARIQTVQGLGSNLKQQTRDLAQLEVKTIRPKG